MSKLYLVRHGETEYNDSLRFQGQIDIPLNAKGQAQAAKVGEFFKTIPLAAVYSSSLSRAAETARAIATPQGLQPVLMEEFKEISFGAWEGLTYNQINAKYSDKWGHFFDAPATTVIPEGESMGQVQQRCQQGLRAILAAEHQGDVAIVCHGGVIRVLFCTLLGIDLNNIWRIHVYNASTTRFSYYDQIFSLDYANLDYYLQDLAQAGK